MVKRMNEIDYAIANAILDDCCDGAFDMEVELGNNTFANVRGYVETESYQENNYYNGTGAWITTYADVVISGLKLYTCNDDGDETPCDLEVHEGEIEEYCKEWLLQN